MRVYRPLFDGALTRVDAERAHRVAFGGMRAAAHVPGLTGAGRRWRGPDPRTAGVEAMGLRFRGPLGLAAGFDKNGEGVDALGALGFSFVEVGTVTGRAQPGRPRPRLFRLPQDRAVVNRMGFNNDGAGVVAARLRRRRERGGTTDLVVGVNIGRTKAVDEQDAVGDYELSTRQLAPYADYLAVNVSSPNTPGLRALQSVDRLRPLLEAVRRQAEAVRTDRVPLLVKIAPDLTEQEVAAVAGLAVELGLDGIIATNTTVDRTGLRTDADTVDRLGKGGLSGAPLAARSVAVLRQLRACVGEALTLVSVGGIGTAEDAQERLRAGATLVQAYTAFVYEGPAWPGRVQRELVREGAHPEDVA